MKSRNRKGTRSSKRRCASGNCKYNFMPTHILHRVSEKSLIHAPIVRPSHRARPIMMILKNNQVSIPTLSLRALVLVNQRALAVLVRHPSESSFRLLVEPLVCVCVCARAIMTGASALRSICKHLIASWSSIVWWMRRRPYVPRTCWRRARSFQSKTQPNFQIAIWGNAAPLASVRSCLAIRPRTMACDWFRNDLFELINNYKLFSVYKTIMNFYCNITLRLDPGVRSQRLRYS